MKSPHRPRLLVVLVALSVLSFAASFVWLRLTVPSDGAVVKDEGPGAETRLVLTPLRLHTTALNPGDIILAVDGRSLEAWAQAALDPFAPHPPLRFGQVLVYRLVREGQEHDVAVTLKAFPFGAAVTHHWGELVYALVFQVIGTFVFVRRPDDRAARAMLVSAAAASSSAVIRSLELQVSDFLNAVGLWLAAPVSAGIYLLYYIGTLHFTLVFPRPHPLITRYRRSLPLVYGMPFALYLLSLAVTRYATVGTLDWLASWRLGGAVIMLLYLILAVVTMADQYRRTHDMAARQQMRWGVWAAIVSGTIIVVFRQLPGVLWEWRPLDANSAWAVATIFPVALAMAILRFQLFDIDLIINRTLVYSTLTIIIVAIYVLMVGYLGEWLHEVIGNLAISLLATGLVALLFQPLRDRLQRGVNRLMYGERDDPYAVLSRLGGRLEATLAPEAVLPTIVETVAQALKLPYVALALKQGAGDEFKVAASYGLPAAPRLSPLPSPLSRRLSSEGDEVLPLVYQGDLIGQLILARRAPDESFTLAERRLLEDIARQTGVAAHAVRLTADLQRSRERLVTAREEERRRLRRDLHDGLGPALASLPLKLDAARNLLARDPQAAETLLLELKTQTQSAVADIRRLVYDLRPPTLDELGLVTALQRHAEQYPSVSGPSVTIEAPTEGLPPLPAAVEVAAYRIALEAMTNVVRHARAHRCHVRFSLAGVAGKPPLQLEISDDGIGLPRDFRSGVGLASMRERAAELGGTCVIEPLPTGGTRVVARLPLPQEM